MAENEVPEDSAPTPAVFELEQTDAYSKYLLYSKSEILAILRVLIQKGSMITAYFDQAKLACDSIKKDATRFAAFYHDSMRRSMADRIFILDNLDKAIEQGHIQVYYQPVIRTMTGKLCGCEALARWIDPVKGTISPGR